MKILSDLELRELKEVIRELQSRFILQPVLNSYGQDGVHKVRFDVREGSCQSNYKRKVTQNPA
jgi:hypothetical protein